MVHNTIHIIKSARFTGFSAVAEHVVWFCSALPILCNSNSNLYTLSSSVTETEDINTWFLWCDQQEYTDPLATLLSGFCLLLKHFWTHVHIKYFNCFGPKYSTSKFLHIFLEHSIHSMICAKVSNRFIYGWLHWYFLKMPENFCVSKLPPSRTPCYGGIIKKRNGSDESGLDFIHTCGHMVHIQFHSHCGQFHPFF